ncbi:hypothetical protein ENSA5_43160 [Enhygromyxa salina]|uniref:Uncharacterized protein n=1 Tax=Enhygromyxa salina TaxID=215803 RepID=A0A2S9XK91_9BACT|nr:hypothetical protein [Enhygromyxa salina]PRP93294.1 hypothetical protein ENSA5_43160 [Enhygromyxa salina]
MFTFTGRTHELGKHHQHAQPRVELLGREPAGEIDEIAGLKLEKVPRSGRPIVWTGTRRGAHQGPQADAATGLGAAVVAAELVATPLGRAPAVGNESTREYSHC